MQRFLSQRQSHAIEAGNTSLNFIQRQVSERIALQNMATDVAQAYLKEIN